MRPSDSVIFVKKVKKQSLLLIDNTDVDTEFIVTAIGESAKEEEVPTTENSDINFRKLVVGDTVILADGTESWSFEKDDVQYKVFIPTNVKLCLR
jgi:putative transposon-encoded protein